MNRRQQFVGNERFAVVDLRGDASARVELNGAHQPGAPAARTDAVLGHLRKGQHEIYDGRFLEIEDVNVEVERFTWLDGAAVQVCRAKDKGAGPVMQAAGTVGRLRHRLENTRVRASGPLLAFPRVVALVRAQQLAKDGAESAAHNVAGFPGREIDRVASYELEPERQQVEILRTRGLGGAVNYWRNVLGYLDFRHLSLPAQCIRIPQIPSHRLCCRCWASLRMGPVGTGPARPELATRSSKPKY